MVKENDDLVLVVGKSSEDHSVNFHEQRVLVVVDPLAYVWLRNRVVVQDFDCHKELNEVDEPFLYKLIPIGFNLKDHGA